MSRRLGLVALALVLVLIIGVGALLRPELPAVFGDLAVGRERIAWVDARPEVMTPYETDQREVVLEMWYPARPSTGAGTAYVPELSRIADGLVQSGELGWIAVQGLHLVRAHAALEADVSDRSARYPVVLFSPGAATNVEFYASVAEDLASRGFVVLGINHPYDVAAVALTDGRVAVAPAAQQTLGPAARTEHVARRVDERVADMLSVVDRVRRSDGVFGPLSDRIDADRISVIGHSLGGIAAAQTCVSDARLRSCGNLDGLQGGGPFSVRPGGSPPRQPFLFITKERDADRYASATVETTIIPTATHRDFTDGPLIEPSLGGNSSSREVIDRVRARLAAFLERTLS